MSSPAGMYHTLCRIGSRRYGSGMKAARFADVRRPRIVWSLLTSVI